MTTLKIRHVLHTGYTSTVATALSLTGPSPDGFVHVTFFRDATRITEETLSQEVLQSGDVEVIKISPQENRTEHVREDVACIAIPVAKLGEVAEVIARMHGHLQEASKVQAQYEAGTEA